MNKLVANKDGLRLVEELHQQILNGQADWVLGQPQLELQSLSLKDLPPRTPQQERDMAWDEGLMK